MATISRLRQSATFFRRVAKRSYRGWARWPTSAGRIIVGYVILVSFALAVQVSDAHSFLYWFAFNSVLAVALVYVWRLKPYWIWVSAFVAISTSGPISHIVVRGMRDVPASVRGILPTPPPHAVESQTLYWTQLTFFATFFGALLSVIAIYVGLGLLMVSWVDHRRSSRRPRLAIEFGRPGHFLEEPVTRYDASTGGTSASVDGGLYRVDTPSLYIRNMGDATATKLVLIVEIPRSVRPADKDDLKTPLSVETCHAAGHFAFECKPRTYGTIQDYWDLPFDLPPETRSDVAPLRLFVPVGTTHIACQITSREMGRSWTNRSLWIVLKRGPASSTKTVPVHETDAAPLYDWAT